MSMKKATTQSPVGLLQLLPIPCQVWEDISIDFVEGLPSAHGMNAIFVTVDCLTKYAHFFPISHPYTTKIIASKFVDGVIRLHGFPRSIVSDRDLVFRIHFWKEFFKMSDTQLNMTSSYHSQSNA